MKRSVAWFSLLILAAFPISCSEAALAPLEVSNPWKVCVGFFLTALGGWLIYRRTHRGLNFGPWALGFGLAFMVGTLIKPAQLEIHLLPINPIFWVALIAWCLTKLIPTKIDENLFMGGLLGVLVLILATRGLLGIEVVSNPAWWFFLCIWIIVIAEKLILDDPWLKLRPAIQFGFLSIGWYVVGILA